MSVDLTSLVLCRNLYLDYYYKGNKAGTSVSDIKLIEQEYSDYLTKWSAIGKSSENDTNEYAISEDEWSLTEKEGKKQAQDETGYKSNGWKNAGNVALTGTNAVISAAGGLAWAGVGQGIGGFAVQAGAKVSTKAGQVLGTQAVSGLGAQIGSKLSGNVAKNVTNKGAEAVSNAADKGTDKFGNGAWVIAIPIELASAILAISTNQNGKEADALAELTGQMTTAQGELLSAQTEMEAAATLVAEKEQEFLDINEESSNQMITLQTKTDTLYRMYTNLKNKEARGVTLTDGEKYLLASCEANIESNNTSQDSIQVAAETAMVETTEEVSAQSEVYDAAGTTIAETQGMTDYGASFDNCTKVLCWVAMISDGLNAVGAAKNGWKAGAFAASGTWAFGATAWAWAWVAMAASAAVMSGIDAVRQYNYLKTTNEEIGVRETTQEYTENVYGTYDTDITEFDGSMQSMSEQEILDLQKKEISL